mmetsp:Transcript_87793/g.155408  ORF Transcript_87793/g.155408 Transcript_87793/m.155408 type:complete len:202 (+) Transcript_87793:112-717(+)
MMTMMMMLMLMRPRQRFKLDLLSRQKPCDQPLSQDLCSIDLDRAIDRPDKYKGGDEADGTSDEGKRIRYNEHVAKVQHSSHVKGDLHPCEVVEARIQEDIECRGCARKEGAPPPIVVLTGELKVREGNGDLCTSHYEDDDDQHQKPEKVVELMLPDRGHDEEKLREDGAEGQDTPNKRREEGTDVPRLRRHLPWDLVRSHR